MPAPHVLVMEAAEQPWYWTPEWWVAVGTVGLAVVTTILAWYTYRLFKAAQEARTDSLKALAIAERNADAAHESTLLARESMERDLRAYVVIESVDITKWNLLTQNPDTKIPDTIIICVRNTGRTPATRTDLNGHFGLFPIKPNSEGSASKKINTSLAIIGSGHERIVPIDKCAEVTSKFLECPTDGAEVYFQGCIEYHDLVSMQARTTHFEYTWKFGDQIFKPGEGNSIT